MHIKVYVYMRILCEHAFVCVHVCVCARVCLCVFGVCVTRCFRQRSWWTWTGGTVGGAKAESRESVDPEVLQEKIGCAMVSRQLLVESSVWACYFPKLFGIKSAHVGGTSDSAS